MNLKPEDMGPVLASKLYIAAIRAEMIVRNGYRGECLVQARDPLGTMHVEAVLESIDQLEQLAMEIRSELKGWLARKAAEKKEASA